MLIQVAMHIMQYKQIRFIRIEIINYGAIKVVIGRGPTPVKTFVRLRLQNCVPCIVPQPLARVLTMV